MGGKRHSAGQDHRHKICKRLQSVARRKDDASAVPVPASREVHRQGRHQRCREFCVRAGEEVNLKQEEKAMPAGAESQCSCVSRDELLSKFEYSDGTSKHLLTLYSLVIGLNARVIVDLGLGQTTGVLRSAARQTGGTVYSCDADKRRFSPLLADQDDHWKLYLEFSASFLQKVPEPIDFVMHDSAHDYVNVKRDLEMILPKMRQFGMICVHDTQQTDLHQGMLAAMRDATRNFSVSMTNLPFNAGLGMIRVESSPHPPITPASGKLPDGRSDTTPVAF